MDPEIARYAGHCLAAPLTLGLAALSALFIPIIIRRDDLTPGLAVLSAALALLVFLPSSRGASFSMFDGALGISPSTGYLWPFFLAALALTVLISLNARRGKPGAGEYYFLLALAALALLLLVTAGELLTVFISLELLSVCLYALSAVNRSPAGAEAGYKYFLLGSLGAGFLVMGIALIHGTLGTIHFDALRQAMPPGLGMSALTATGFIFLIAGFSFKAALVPFHAWVPDVYEGAPTPVSAFMGSAVKAGVIIVLYRLFSVTAEAPQFKEIFWALAALTMILGNLLALPQQNMKRLLAYSSIAHAGYIVTGFFGGPEGLTAVLFYLAVYALATIGAFAVVAALEKEERGVRVKDLAGLSGRHPYLAGAMALFMLSLAGIPPLAGFFGKFYVFAAALRAGYIWLTVLALIMSAVSLYYYLKVLVVMYMEPEHAALHPFPSHALFLALALLALAVAGLGVFSSPLLSLAKTASAF
jgi:NADH-quinone oxidoreductase subunit N